MAKAIEPAQPSTIWNYVYDGEVLRTGDAEHAERQADYVAQSMEVRASVDRARLRRNVGKIAGLWLGGLLLLSGFLSGGYGLLWMEGNDHAGLDRKQVGSKSGEAVLAYYGQNDRPDQLVLTETKRSDLRGKEAWAVEYVKPDNGLLCVYVWDTRSTQEIGYEVIENKGC